MAATVADAPYAFATIVDDARSFWKSRFGLGDGAPRQNTVEESFCKYVVRSKGEVIVDDAAIDERTRDNPSVKSMGVRAWAGFPLMSPDGEVLGSFCIVDVVPRHWTSHEIEVVKTLAHAASREITLRAALEDERRGRIAAQTLSRTLQESLLPPVLPRVPGLEVGAHYRAAGEGEQLVGDFYDVFQTGPDTWAFVIGDVCGKGVEAAKIAALARYTVGAAAMQHRSPTDVLSLLNGVLVARNDPRASFLTTIFGTINPNGRGQRVTLACAGHPEPIVRRADGSTSLCNVRGSLVGAFEDFSAGEIDVQLDPGDALVLYTDGASEARNADGNLFGEERILDVIASAPDDDADALSQRTLDAVLDYSAGTVSDDVAVLVLRVNDAA